MQLENNTLASHPFDSIKRSKSQGLRKPKSKPILLACGDSLNVTIFQFHGGFQVIPKNNPTLPMDDSLLIPKRRLTYNIESTNECYKN